MRYVNSIAVLLTVLAHLLLVSGCADDNGDRDRLAAGRQNVAEQHLDQALINYKSALQANPNDRTARLELARIYLAIGLGAEAEKELNAAIALGAAEDTLRNELVEAALLRNETKRAQGLLTEIDSTAMDASATALLGDALWADGKPEAIRKQYEKALAMDAQNPYALYGLARLELRENNTERALSVSDSLTRTARPPVRAWVLRGNVLYAAEDFAAAEKAYLRASELFRNSPEANAGLIKSALLLKRPDDARKYLAVLERSGAPDVFTNYYEGLIAYDAEDWGAARDRFRAVLANAPTHLPSLIRLGSIEYLSGSYEVAADYLHRYINRRPTDWQARKLLAAAQSLAGHDEKALSVISEAPAGSVDNEELDRNLARIYGRLGQHDKAMALFKDRLANGEANSELHLAIAASALASGDLDASISSLEQASAGTGDQPLAKQLLALAQVASGDFPSAINTTEALAEQVPSDPTTENLLGAIYANHGDLAAAKKAFEAALERDGSYATAIVNLARFDLLEGNVEAARDRAETFVKAHGENALIEELFGQIARAENQPEQALSHYRHALELDPDRIEAHLYLSEFELNQNNLPAASSHANHAYRLAPDNTAARLLVAITRYANGDAKGAAEMAKMIVATNNQTIESYIVASRILLNTGNPELANDALETVLARTPNNGIALALLARAAFASGNGNRASQLAETLVKGAPEDPEALNLAAQAALLAENFDLALRHAKTLRTLAPDKLSHVLIESRVKQLTGDEAAARKGYRQALEQNPANPFALLNLVLLDAASPGPDYWTQFGRARDTNRKVSGALLQLLDTAEKLHNTEQANGVLDMLTADASLPANQKAHVAAALLRQQKFAEAFTLLEAAYASSPDNEGVAIAYARLENARGGFARAAEVLDGVLQTAPDNGDALHQRAMAAAGLGDGNAALEFAKRADKLGFKHSKLLVLLGDAQLGAGDFAAARETAQRQQAEWPDDTSGWMLESMVLQRQNELTQSIELIERRDREAPHSILKLRVIDLLWAAGDKDQARARLAQWITQNKQDTLLRMRMAEINIFSDDCKAALPDLEFVQEIEGATVRTLNPLAWCYDKLDDQRAESTARHALDLEPGNALVQDTLAWILLRKQKNEQSLTLLESAFKQVQRLATPDAGTLQYHYALALSRTGSKRRAIELLDELVKLDIAFPERESAELFLQQLSGR